MTVAVETRDPLENAAPWTKVGVVDWAAAVRGRSAAKVAASASPAIGRVEGKCFKRNSLFYTREEWAELERGQISTRRHLGLGARVCRQLAN